uniref:Arf-GAP domain-containing protein n=1 Tax=Macrostomum lignano TaxID=282301 RepID=A0A1I8JSD5_9PLAT
MENSHGKDIDLSRTTVKIPGQLRPTSNGLLKSQQQQQQQPEDGSKKRRHRRAKSGNRGGGGGGADQDVEESDGYEFMIVSLENRTWHFEAASQEERDEWPARPVSLRQLRHQRRLVELPRRGGGGGGGSSGSGSIRGVFGNSECADCGRPGPDWASLNLGALVCIECSGVHRQLGTHLSRIRSLTLDDWPANHLLVMRAIGNKLANSARLPCHATFRKPSPESDREAKEIFIRAKYERREFLPDLPFRDSPVQQQQLVDAIARSDTRQVRFFFVCDPVPGGGRSRSERALLQARSRAAIHIAATLGQLVYLQLLLWHGADVAIRDAEGRNAHFYATAAGKPDCAEFLRAAGCQLGCRHPPPPRAPLRLAANSPISNPQRHRLGGFSFGRGGSFYSASASVENYSNYGCSAAAAADSVVWQCADSEHS